MEDVDHPLGLSPSLELINLVHGRLVLLDELAYMHLNQAEKFVRLGSGARTRTHRGEPGS